MENDDNPYRFIDPNLTCVMDMPDFPSGSEGATPFPPFEDYFRSDIDPALAPLPPLNLGLPTQIAAHQTQNVMVPQVPQMLSLPATSRTVGSRLDNRSRGTSFGTMNNTTASSASPYGSVGDDNNDARSASPPNDKAVKSHKRGYQACENCRQRKSRCVPQNGSVDNPSPPPCSRCARERIECLFADTRKKRKTTSDNEVNDQPGKRRLTSTDPTADLNAFRQTHRSASNLGSPQYGHNGFQSPSQQWTNPGLMQSYTSHPAELSYNVKSESIGGGAHIRSEVAKETFRSPVATTQDNLQMLVNAAVQTSGGPDKMNELKSPAMGFGSPMSVHSSRPRAFSTMSNAVTPAQPAFAGSTVNTNALVNHESFAAARRVWEHMRFVRAGWFTVLEAMQYVEYFYVNMAPMTPVLIPDYRSPARHHALLSEEPILAIALLAIASRHMPLEGHAAVSRSYQIHDKLWTYLRQMIERLLWAQEQFGGGFCGAGAAAKVSETSCGQITWKGSLRTLGTIEALLLLTEWQPRALHFPPGDEENRLLDGRLELLAELADDQIDVAPKPSNTSLPFANWLEPSWRSDRMSWMLLGLAQSLSFELGVFDKGHHVCQNTHDQSSECARTNRLRRLVLVYVSQTSGRLGIPSMLPLDLWQDDPVCGEENAIQRSGQPEAPVDVMLSCWLQIANIMYLANLKIFPSRPFTRDLVLSGQYKERIEEFRHLLRDWKNRFDSLASQIQPLMRHILTMEYEYARTYINSLGLQKVMESWVGKPGVDLQATLRPNQSYIEEVTDAARNILRNIADGIAPGGHLRNAPTRIYIRSVSGFMFTLKRFALGMFEGDVRESLSLLERAAEVMGDNVVDDVHLANPTSKLVTICMNNIKDTFIRVRPANGSDAASHEGSRQNTPHHQIDQGQNQSVGHVGPSRSEGHSKRSQLVRADPLAAIQSHSMSDITKTIMPPHSYNFQNPGFDESIPIDPSIDYQSWNTDWLALPLDRFFNDQSADMNVDQGFGGIGPTVGGRDMLELITDQQYNTGQWDGSNLFNSGY